MFVSGRTARAGCDGETGNDGLCAAGGSVICSAACDGTIVSGAVIPSIARQLFRRIVYDCRATRFGSLSCAPSVGSPI